jgi:phosphotransferase system enzyme I (PtsI)
MKELAGQGVSPGIAMGHAVKVDVGVPPVLKIRLRPEDVPGELLRFDEAVARTTAQLGRIEALLLHELGRQHSAMIGAHILILQDDHFSGAIRRHIAAEAVNAEWAVKVVTERLQMVYVELHDAYLREKLHDIADIADRLLLNIAGRAREGSSRRHDDVIVVCPEISLSLFSEINLKHLKGFAVDFGGWTSHTSIIARSLKIPAVTHLRDITAGVHTGDFLIVDGSAGMVFVNPDPETVEHFRGEQGRQDEVARGPYCLLAAREAEAHPAPPGLGALYINAELPHDLDDYAELDVAGVGLFRSEFLFLGRPVDSITVAEHEVVYRRLAERAHPAPANIRTFDLGADKIPELRERFHETNPALGMRGIRLSILLQEAFRRQLEGILRANDRGNLRLTFPFVASVDEVRTAKDILADVAAQAGLQDRLPIPLGVMLEIPSTIFIIDALAGEADFFALGTNDLVQYTVAHDRNGSSRASAFAPAHPAVRRGLEMIFAGTSERGKEVICCGEMAAHPFFLLLLLAVGFRHFSVNKPYLPLARYVLRNVDEPSLGRFHGELAKLATLDEIERLFLERLPEFFSRPFVETLLELYRLSS